MTKYERKAAENTVKHNPDNLLAVLLDALVSLGARLAKVEASKVAAKAAKPAAK